MKKIVCMLLALVICLGLFVGCTAKPGTVYDQRFTVIESLNENSYIVYDCETTVVYYIDVGSYGGYLTPYQIYTVDGMCGAIYAEGEIRPVPYSICVNENTIDNLINSAFGSP